MSSLAATTSAVYCSVCEAIAKFVKSTFKSWILARQLQANQHVAEQLIRTGEYRTSGHTVHSLWNELNRKTIKEFNGAE